MLKKLGLVVCLAAGLGGCATQAGTMPTPAPTTSIDSVISQVQAITQKACSFVPTVSVIASIFQVEGAANYLNVAQEICAAVNTPAARRGHRPSVRGVPLDGRFVR